MSISNLFNQNKYVVDCDKCAITGGVNNGTSHTSGDLVVSGGVGIGGNCNINGSATLSGALNLGTAHITSTLNTTQYTSGALVVDGGAGFAGNVVSHGTFYDSTGPISGRSVGVTGSVQYNANGTETFGGNTNFTVDNNTPGESRLTVNSPGNSNIYQILASNDTTGARLAQYNNSNMGSIVTDDHGQLVLRSQAGQKVNVNGLLSLGDVRICTTNNYSWFTDLATDGSGNLSVSPNGLHTTITATTNTTTTGAGALIVNGGVGVGGNIVSGGNVYNSNGIIAPGAPTNALQYNNNGSFSGSDQFTINNSDFQSPQISLYCSDLGTRMNMGIIDGNRLGFVSVAGFSFQVFTNNQLKFQVGNVGFSVYRGGTNNNWSFQQDASDNLLISSSVAGTSFTINTTADTDLTSVTSGALVVSGGLSVAKRIIAGNTIIANNGLSLNSKATISNNSGTDSIYLTPYNNAQVFINSTAEAAFTNTSSGSLVVSGGVSIAKTLQVQSFANIGGNCSVIGGHNVGGQLAVADTTDSTATNLGALHVTGGIGCGGRCTFGGTAQFN